ncbi:CTP synthase 2-like [Corticium candelabrum]|uniref:CTP synthase 2-like n=1 Tax=Corticium candelabrum TaxID=121492 RepID=UPI002E255010|nr:CTP synthase 2-like [Corticium candelabrum]
MRVLVVRFARREREEHLTVSLVLGVIMKYILVCGAVISGIGKGVVASSVGTILKSCGLRVTSIKIDPYLNIDAGTFSPYEHGEVFVLDDGGEVDLDLGNYERFMDVKLHSKNNITTGKIYKQVIERERKGDYLGKTVQVVPHVTDAIQDWVMDVARQSVDSDKQPPEVCIIELGGTIGDIEGMPFIEAFRQFQFRAGKDNFCCLLVSLVPQPGPNGVHKTKPIQHSVRELRGQGLSPDLIICRSQTRFEQSVTQKISNFCHVEPHNVINIEDFASIYRVPLRLHEAGIVAYFAKRLGLPISSPRSRTFLSKWRDLANRFDRVVDEVTIALVGKYTRFEDAYISVTKALKHAALSVNRKLIVNWIDAEHLEHKLQATNPVKYHDAWKQLCTADGILVPGGFGSRGAEGKTLAANHARTSGKPYLGVCLGFQVAVIDIARNVLGWTDAHSLEFDPTTTHPVVIEMPEHNPGEMGGTMRLGKRKTIFTDKDCILRKLYKNKDFVEERHRHRYEVNPLYIEEFKKTGLKFVGQDSNDKQRLEMLELPVEMHPYFVAVQYHPEFLSRPLIPSPPFLGLILAACGNLQAYLERGSRLSPRFFYGSEMSEYKDDSSDEEVKETLAFGAPETGQMSLTERVESDQ